jgi:hypothetical protein
MFSLITDVPNIEPAEPRRVTLQALGVAGRMAFRAELRSHYRAPAFLEVRHPPVTALPRPFPRFQRHQPGLPEKKPE